MPIAIKEITDSDKSAFQEFLKTKRKPLPGLNYSQLPAPHDEIAIIRIQDVNIERLKSLANELDLVLGQHQNHIYTLSRNIESFVDTEGNSCLFSGYVFHGGKMLIGMEEVIKQGISLAELNEEYGEHCILTVKDGSIRFSQDFFGMVPLAYYDDGGIFASSNNYHLLLLLLQRCGTKLSMNIKRSRVNLVTSGFTFGSPFTRDLDVNNCKELLAYEKLNFDPQIGLNITHTSLYDILNTKLPYDEDAYEDLIYKAKEEIYSNCKAVFEHERFKKVVVDISGGFDSRIVFATACNLPKKLRSKMMTFTRTSGTPDDVEKASAIANMYDYPKYDFIDEDTSDIFADGSAGEKLVELSQVSRSLGRFSPNSHLYLKNYYRTDLIELTGYLGEVVLGYKRCYGEVHYQLGDQRLLERLGGCYLHNSVSNMQEVFRDQKEIINTTLSEYNEDCLFKKFHWLYINFRNRHICGSLHNVERNNLRIPMLFSKYALMAKWMHFNKFTDNRIPDERVSVDLVSLINPLIGALPFASNNDDVIPEKVNQLNPVDVNIMPNNSFEKALKVPQNSDLYRIKALSYMDDLEIAKQMLLYIYDYSRGYENALCGVYKVLTLFEEDAKDLRTRHGREQIRKIYDVYYQIRLCK